VSELLLCAVVNNDKNVLQYLKQHEKSSTKGLITNKQRQTIHKHATNKKNKKTNNKS